MLALCPVRSISGICWLCALGSQVPRVTAGSGMPVEEPVLLNHQTVLARPPPEPAPGRSEAGIVFGHGSR